MLYQKLLTTTITGCGDGLQHQPISEAKIILECLPRQLRTVRAVGYITKPCLIPCCLMEAVSLLASCQIVLPFQLSYLGRYLLTSLRKACFTYACPMAYVVESGTS